MSEKKRAKKAIPDKSKSAKAEKPSKLRPKSSTAKRRSASDASREIEDRKDWSEADLSGFEIQGKSLSHTKFRRSKLARGTLRESAFFFCDFSEADLRKASISECAFFFCNFNGSNLRQLSVRNSFFCGSSFKAAQFEKSKIKTSSLFLLSNLLGARMDDAIVESTGFLFNYNDQLHERIEPLRRILEKARAMGHVLPRKRGSKR